MVEYLASTAWNLIEQKQQQQQQRTSPSSSSPRSSSPPPRATADSIFTPSEKCRVIKEKLLKFMDEYIYPNEELFEKQINEGK